MQFNKRACPIGVSSKPAAAASVRRQKSVEISKWVCYNAFQTQGSYIGNTTASQAVKAGSIPVPCSKAPKRVPFYFRESNPSKCNSPGDCCSCPAGRAWLLCFSSRREEKCKSIPVPCSNAPKRVPFFRQHNRSLPQNSQIHMDLSVFLFANTIIPVFYMDKAYFAGDASAKWIIIYRYQYIFCRL